MDSNVDLVLTDATVHTVAGEPARAEAVAIADNRIVRVGDGRFVARLIDVETEVIECGGRVVLPGFIDAHSHLESTGRSILHADLSSTSTREEAFELLRAEEDAGSTGWLMGIGYDESGWPEGRLLRRWDLDQVSTERPVVAFREDMHTAGINSVALERLADDLPADDLEFEDGEPTGLLVEHAVGVIREHAERGESMTELVRLAQRRALARGVTCVHDMVRHSAAPRVYRTLDRAGELDLRVRLNYWRDHLDAVEELGLRTNHGSDFVEFGAIKSFSDGAIGGRTAKVSVPFNDGEGRGTWVVEPDTLRAVVDRADGGGHQLTIHAIGDDAIGTVLELLASTDDPRGSRHRIEHVELPNEDHIEGLADVGVIASMQPNFLKWADEDGLYDHRLGEARSRASNPLRTLVDAGVNVAFGSDGMPVGPLFGIHWAVNARDPCQRLSIDEAIEAYTLGSAYAGFAEARLGSIEPGKVADLVVLEESPWEQPDAIDEIEVWKTIVDGEVVYDAA